MATKTYPIDDRHIAELRRRFTYHAPRPELGQLERYARLRDETHALALRITELTPPGREQALALTHLEQAVMWANAAIARGEATLPAEEANRA